MPALDAPTCNEGTVNFDKCHSCGRKGTFDGVPIYECRKCHHLFCVQCAVKMGKRTDRCPKRARADAANLNSIRAQHHLAFTNGFTTARAVLMNSSAGGLSVRFFNVVMAIVSRALSKATGNALSVGCLPGNINV